MGERLGAERGPGPEPHARGSRTTRPRRAPCRRRGASHASKPPTRSKQLAADEQVGGLVQADLALDPDRAVERPERRVGIGHDAALHQVGRPAVRAMPAPQPPGRREHVGVAERQRGAAARGDPGVARRGRARGGWLTEHRDRARGRLAASAAVASREPSSTTITSNSPLERLARERRQRPRQRRRRVAGGDDHADLITGGDCRRRRLPCARCASPSPMPSAGRRSAAGAERFVPALGAALARRGHEVVHFSVGLGPRASRSRTACSPSACARRRSDRLPPRGRLRPAAARRARPRALRRRALARSPRCRRLDPRRAPAPRRPAHGDHRPRTSPTGEWWREQGAAGAGGGPRGAGHRRLQLHVADRRSTRSPAATAAATASSSPAASIWAAFSPPPSASRARRSCSRARSTSSARASPVLLDALPLVAEREPDVVLWLSGPGNAERLLAAAPPGGARAGAGCSASARPSASTSATAGRG